MGRQMDVQKIIGIKAVSQNAPKIIPAKFLQQFNKGIVISENFLLTLAYKVLQLRVFLYLLGKF
jgi:hypothetical protein